MKKIVEVQEVDGEGLESLMGENVLIFCMNYIYSGRLTGVNDTCILLENGGIVYETGSFTSAEFKDFQKVADKFYVKSNTIESFCQTNKVK